MIIVCSSDSRSNTASVTFPLRHETVEQQKTHGLVTVMPVFPLLLSLIY